MKRLWTLALLPALITGCGGTTVPVTQEMITETGEVVKVTSSYVKDASMAKEETVHQTLRHRDAMIAKSNATPSFTMGWQTVEETVYYPGMSAPITVKKSMPIVTYTEKIQFTQPLPIEPSRHPMWTAITTLGGAVINGTLIGYGIHEVSDLFGSIVKTSKSNVNLNADNLTLNDSLNNPTLTNGANGVLTYSPGTQPAQAPVIIEPTFATPLEVPTVPVL
jgi:hypothetical protein